MPHQIYNEDTIRELLPKAKQIRMKTVGDEVKIKLRTAKTLYTFVTTPGKAEELTRNQTIIEL